MARQSYYGRHKMTVLGLVYDRVKHHDQPPSVRELADSVGVGVATMHLYLKRMSGEGLIEWEPSKHRSLRLSPRGIQMLSS